MCRLFKIRPPSRKGWSLQGKYSSRKDMIKMTRKLRSEQRQVQAIKTGGLAAKFPYEIYEKTR